MSQKNETKFEIISAEKWFEKFKKPYYPDYVTPMDVESPLEDWKEKEPYDIIYLIATLKPKLPRTFEKDLKNFYEYAKRYLGWK